MALTRSDLQKLAQIKFDDAVFLFEHRRYGNAYYLAGYSVEMGLKACIARQIREEEIPDKSFIQSVYTHNPVQLVGLAGLSAELRAAERENDQFQANWGMVANWKPEQRYAILEPMEAQWLITAIGDPEHGVLKWIKTHW
jgi:HEPN domain-containing protein